MLKQRKSQLEVILIILFLLILISITPQNSITGKPTNSPCGTDDYGNYLGACYPDEECINNICKPKTEEPIYVVPPPTTPEESKTCEDYGYERCYGLEPYCPFGSRITEDVPDPETCCLGECVPNTPCHPSTSTGRCRTYGSYVGSYCRIDVNGDYLSGSCKSKGDETEADVIGCICKCNNGDKECLDDGKTRVYCLAGEWKTETCDYNCKDGECTSEPTAPEIKITDEGLCPDDGGPCADQPPNSLCYTKHYNERGTCNEKCECIIDPKCEEGEKRCEDRYTKAICKDGEWDFISCKKERCNPTTGECETPKIAPYYQDNKACLEAIEKFGNRYRWNEYEKKCECATVDTECKPKKYFSKEIGAQVIDFHDWKPYEYGDGTDCICDCPDAARFSCEYGSGELTLGQKGIFDSEKCLCYPKLETCEGLFGQVCYGDDKCLCGKEKLLYSSQTGKISRCCLPGITLTGAGKFTKKAHCGKIEPDYECSQQSIDESRLLFAIKLLEAGKNRDAKSIFQDLEKDSSIKAKALASHSFLLAREGKFSEALASAKQALKENPNDQAVISATNKVIITIGRLMIAGLGKSSVEISRSYANKMGSGERLPFEKGYLAPLEKNIEDFLNPDLYKSEDLVLEQLKIIASGVGNAMEAASGIFVSGEQYIQNQLKEEYLLAAQQAQNELVFRGTTILTLSALLKQGISFDSIIKATQECEKDWQSKPCRDLDGAVYSLPQQNIKSLYNEHKIAPHLILTDFFKNDKDGKLLSQYGEVPEEEFREGVSPLFRFQDPSLEEARPFRESTEFWAILEKKTADFLAKELSSDLLLLYVLPQTKLTAGGATLAQWISHKTGISAISTLIGPKLSLLADVLAPIGTCAVLQQAGADPEVVKMVGKLLAFFRPFSSGFQAADLYAAKTFNKQFTKGIDEAVFSKDTLKYKPDVVKKFNSILNKKLNAAAEAGTSVKSAYRTAVYESLHEAAGTDLVGKAAEKLSEELANKLTKIAEKALYDTVAKISASKSLQASLSSKVYCGLIRESSLRIYNQGVYTPEQAAQYFTKGKFAGEGTFAEVFEGKLKISPKDKIKFLADLSPEDFQRAMKKGVVIKIPNQRVVSGAPRQITREAVAALRKEIDLYIEIARRAPNLNAPKPLFEIIKVDPATGIEYSTFVMTAIKNPAGAFHVSGNMISVSVADLINGDIRANVYIAPDFWNKLRIEVEKLHKAGIVHNDLLNPKNILIDAEGNPVIIDLGQSQFRAAYERAGTAWSDATYTDIRSLELMQPSLARVGLAPPAQLTAAQQQFQNVLDQAVEESFRLSTAPPLRW